MNPLNSGNQSQNPKEQALDLMRQQGIAIPDGMGDNPNALIQYVMQSGRYPQNRLTMAQQIMQKMFRR
jgi:hypothetical protein